MRRSRRQTAAFRDALLLSLGLFLWATLAFAQSCPDWRLGGPPQAVEATALAGGAGLRIDVVAGGGLNLAACASLPGTGWVTQAPNLKLSLHGVQPGQTLNLSVRGACDTVLLVNDPAGRWHFNDDAPGGGVDPALSIPDAVNGVYDIWVGSYASPSCPATLGLATAIPGADSGGARVIRITPPGATDCAPDLPRDASGAILLPTDPGDLRVHARPGCVGQVFSVPVTGFVHYTATVVGGMDGLYAAQSTIAVAAVHAGVLAAGQTARPRLQLHAPQVRFSGGLRNGVSSLSQTGGSALYAFRFLR